MSDPEDDKVEVTHIPGGNDISVPIVTDIDWDAQQLKQETNRVSNAVYLGMGPCRTALDARLRIQALLEVALELMPQHENIGCTIDQSYFDRINNFRPKVD